MSQLTICTRMEVQRCGFAQLVQLAFRFVVLAAAVSILRNVYTTSQNPSDRVQPTRAQGKDSFGRNLADDAMHTEGNKAVQVIAKYKQVYSNEKALESQAKLSTSTTNSHNRSSSLKIMTYLNDVESLTESITSFDNSTAFQMESQSNQQTGSIQLAPSLQPAVSSLSAPPNPTSPAPDRKDLPNPTSPAPDRKALPNFTLPALDRKTLPNSTLPAPDRKALPNPTSPAPDRKALPNFTLPALDRKTLPNSTLPAPDRKALPNSTLPAPDRKALPNPTPPAPDRKILPNPSSPAPDRKALPNSTLPAPDRKALPNPTPPAPDRKILPNPSSPAPDRKALPKSTPPAPDKKYKESNNLLLTRENCKGCLANKHLIANWPDQLCDQTRLGNKMFMLAAAIAAAASNNLTFVLYDHTKCEWVHQLMRLFQPINTIPQLPVPWVLSWPVALTCGFTCYMPIQINKKNMTVAGLRQSYRYFTKDAEKAAVRDLFTFTERYNIHAHKELKKAAAKVPHGLDPILIGVHMRLGDIVKNSYGYQAANRTFYKRAFQKARESFSSKGLVFVVASDSPQLAKRILEGFDSLFAIYWLNGAAFQDFAVLSKCNHSIISGGTYGFWSAWLSAGQTFYFANFSKLGSDFHKRFHQSNFYLPEWKPVSLN